MHYDSGYMRCASATTVEWALGHNFGGTEALVGDVAPDGRSAVFHSTAMGNVTEVRATQRKLSLHSRNPAEADASEGGSAAEGSSPSPRDPSSLGVLVDEFAMATESVPAMTHHLRATLVRQAAPPK